MRYELRIPYPTPSQNTYTRWHWSEKSKSVNVLRMLIRQQLNNIGMFSVSRPGVRMRIEIHRYSPGELDRGNFIGGCKPLIDALRYEGVIRDDTERWLDDVYLQHKIKRGEQGETLIVVQREDRDEINGR